MKKSKLLIVTLLLAGALSAFFITTSNAAEKKQNPKASGTVKATGKETPPAAHMKLEPKAIDILKAACTKLGAARTMSFAAVVTYESPTRLGPPLAYTTKSEVTLSRPDKLRVMTVGDGPASEFYYNGKTMTAFAPAENLVAVSEAPPTIDATLKAAYLTAATYFPFTDLIVSDPYKDLSEGLLLAFYIGQSKVVGGTTTEMVAYADKEVFAQVWIGVEDKLPRMIRAVYRSDRARLRHQLELSNWRLDQAVPDDAYAPKNAENAKPIAFAHPNAGASKVDKEPAQAKPAKK